MEVKVHTISQEKEINDIQGEGRIKLSVFIGDMIIHVENFEESTKETLRTNK